MKKLIKLSSLLFLTGILIPTNVLAFSKTETVYSTLKSDGSINHTSVTSHLLTVDKSELLDQTELKDILNINGNETFKVDGSTLTWDSDGKDIFYRGTTEKQLPIETKIQYYLNDEEKNVSELIGKKGTIKIVLQFQNKEANEVIINGTKETLYTPFVITLGTMLNNKNNHSISVTNGKVIDTGSKSMIAGIVSPGLYESLGIEELKKFNEITISYNTDNFSSSDIYFAATPKLIEESDFAIFTKLDSMYGKMSTLQQSINTIEQGAKALENGSSVLTNGTKELSTNLGSLLEVMKSLENGSTQLKEGITSLKTGLKDATISFQNNNTQATINSLNDLKAKNSATIEAILKKTSMTQEQLKNLYLANNLVNYTGTDVNLNNAKSSYEFILLLSGNNQAIDQTITSSTELATKMAQTFTQIDSALTNLVDGSTSLNDGLIKTKAAVSKLYNGSNSLVNGSNDLHSGILSLASGIGTFNQEGIQSLTFYTNQMKGYSNKTKALLDLSKNYNGFTSTNSEKTNFVFVVKSTKK